MFIMLVLMLLFVEHISCHKGHLAIIMLARLVLIHRQKCDYCFISFSSPFLILFFYTLLYHFYNTSAAPSSKIGGP